MTMALLLLLLLLLLLSECGFFDICIIVLWVLPCRMVDGYSLKKPNAYICKINVL